MKYDKHRGGYVLTSGRYLYSNGGVLGLSENSPQRALEIFEGWDGSELADSWTPQERAEVADHMIRLWQQFKEQK